MSGRLLGYALPDARAPTASDGMTASAAPALGPFFFDDPEAYTGTSIKNHQLAGTMPLEPPSLRLSRSHKAESSFSSAIVSSGLGSFRQNERLSGNRSLTAFRRFRAKTCRFRQSSTGLSADQYADLRADALHRDAFRSHHRKAFRVSSDYRHVHGIRWQFISMTAQPATCEAPRCGVKLDSACRFILSYPRHLTQDRRQH
jgi:hypothetical protein